MGARGPGGHLVIQDYDLHTIAAAPALDAITELRRVAIDTFTAAGRHSDLGRRLPLLFKQAGIGAPDGTDVAGRLEPVTSAAAELAAVYRSLLPAAVAHGVSTRAARPTWFQALADDIAQAPDTPVLWPLMIGAWKHKPAPLEPALPR